MDISKVCRSCMKEVASWEKENFDTRAVEMFCFCTNIKIMEDDTLPKQFCYDCIIKIESAYTFITEALKVNVTLKNIISRTNTSVIIKPDVHKTNIHLENRLTLPDYKISSTVNNYEQTIFDNVDYAQNYEDEIHVEKIQEIAHKVPQHDVEKKVKDGENEIKNVEKKNVCPVCRKGFTSKAWFDKHMMKEHAGHKYSCTQCHKAFSKPSQLRYHLTSHSEERKFACGACGKRFKRRKQLATHARAHQDARPYACDKCTMRFKLKSVLKCHMKVHEADKQYLCSFCGWSFAQAGNLAVHMRVHTGEKPYSCACGFRAAVASNMRRHQRRHADARSHVCTHCRKGFYDASGLARHMRTHTGELPYVCPAPACARAFADSWKRKTHLMRAHSLALADIPRMRRDGLTVN